MFAKVRRIAVILSTLFFAFSILLISVLRAATVRYAFSAPPTSFKAEKDIKINYILPYPGKVTPDNPFWPLKALRDKAWIGVTKNPGKQAELALLFADKRLGGSKILFERQKPDLAYSTLTKAEKYLEEASNLEKRNREVLGLNTSEFLVTLANASLKHRQVIDEILNLAPEDAKPGVIKTANYSKNIYKNISEVLKSKNIPAPENPFDSD